MLTSSEPAINAIQNKIYDFAEGEGSVGQILTLITQLVEDETTKSYASGYDQGYDIGCEAGFWQGHSEGYSEGYDSGFDEGVAEGKGFA